jgi:hypothetical protein
MNLSMRSFLPPLDLGWNHVRAVCAMPSCHNKLLMRAVPGARAGIYVGETWYCSPDCFAMESRHALAGLFTLTVVEMPRNPRLPLGLALLAKEAISEAQLRFAVAFSEHRGVNLETTLLEQGIVSEKQLAAARATQWGCPVLGHEPAGQTVEADLPPTLLRACSAAPLHYSPKSKRLVLGFVHRVEHPLLQSIEQITGCRAEPCFITPSEFKEQMDRLSPVDGYAEIVDNDPGTVPQMARTLGGLAVEYSGREARFTRCKSWIWARISGKRGTVDVIFPLKAATVSAKREFSRVVPEVTEALG